MRTAVVRQDGFHELRGKDYNFHDPFIQEMFNEAEARVVRKIKDYDEITR